MAQVLFVADSLFPLGPARRLSSRALERLAKGDEIHLATPQADQLPPWLQNLPVTVHALSADRLSNAANSLGTAESAGLGMSRPELGKLLQLRRLIQRLQPTVVEAWGERAANWTGFAAMGWPNMGWPRKRSVDWELIYHETRLPLPPRHLSQWLQQLGGIRFTKAIVSHPLIQQALLEQSFPGSIEVEAFNQRQLHPPGFASSDPSSDPIAARQSLRDHLGLSESTWIAGAVAPLIPRSRLKDLIWATDLLTVIRQDFHFVIFGRGSQCSRLQRFAECTEAAHHVHFLGEPTEAWQWFQGLDVFWQSHLQEPVPQNMLAAMSLGIPVISVLGPGTEDWIRHQQTGFGVNFGARDEFARWTKYLIEQTESANMIRDQGKKFIENRLDR